VGCTDSFRKFGGATREKGVTGKGVSSLVRGAAKIELLLLKIREIIPEWGAREGGRDRYGDQAWDTGKEGWQDIAQTFSDSKK